MKLGEIRKGVERLVGSIKTDLKEKKVGSAGKNIKILEDVLSENTEWVIGRKKKNTEWVVMGSSRKNEEKPKRFEKKNKGPIMPKMKKKGVETRYKKFMGKLFCSPSQRT